ncbi:MAG: hypothetical protein G01um101416_1029 [Microgenomates group bacterium Gr01-1014_16]|nr:MAG: hypothetical protein G01um101416_1029 [Microgenomates group bacterium Gr01-1014_16]
MWVPKEPVLTGSQIKVLVDIFVGVGMVGVGSVVVPALFDKQSLGQVILGLVVTLCFWVAAIYTARNIEV